MKHKNPSYPSTIVSIGSYEQQSTIRTGKNRDDSSSSAENLVGQNKKALTRFPLIEDCQSKNNVRKTPSSDLEAKNFKLTLGKIKSKIQLNKYKTEESEGVNNFTVISITPNGKILVLFADEDSELQSSN